MAKIRRTRWLGCGLFRLKFFLRGFLDSGVSESVSGGFALPPARDTILPEGVAQGEWSSMAADDEILTVKEVCEVFQVHEATIYRLAKAGKIPGFRVGSDWRFRKDVIMRWMAEQPRS